MGYYFKAVCARLTRRHLAQGRYPPCWGAPVPGPLSRQHLLVAPIAQASLREVVVVARDHTVVGTPGVMCSMACEQQCAWRVHGVCMPRMAYAPETHAAIGAPGRVERDKGAEQAVLCGRQLVGGTEEA
eukprot:scaffold80109_cov52-Phaeocystis_antarctica.AAC.2